MDLAPLVRLAARRRHACLALVALVAAVLSSGLSRLRVETGVLDWLPQSDPHVVAFRALFERLGSVVNQELLWLELDAEKAARAGVERISEHEALLAQEELVEYLEARVPAIRGQFGALGLLKAVRAKLAFGETSSAALPRSRAATRFLWGALRTVASGYVDAFIDDDERGTIVSIIYDAPPLSTAARDVGRQIAAALDDYRDDPAREFDLFRDELLVPSGLASGTAFIDRTLIEDLLRWTPPAVLLLALILWWVLGDLRAVLLVLGLLAIGIASTLGLMGWCGATLNIVTIALVPLVLGCGIDYAILIAIETSDRIAEGFDRDAVLDAVARSSATAVLLATTTTAAGLLVLVFSDSPGMADLGLHAAAGMTGLALLAVFVLPAFQLRLGGSRSTRLGPRIHRAAEFLALHRVVVLALLGGATIVGFAFVGQPVVLLDTIDGHYPPDATITKVTHRMRERCGGAFPEIIIARGDLTRPEAIAALERVEKRVASAATPLGGFRTIGAPDLIALARPGAALTGAAPPSREVIVAAIEKLYRDPVLAPLAGMFISPEGDVATVLLLGADPGNSPELVATLWTQLSEIVAEESAASGLEISFLGYRTMAYIFSSYSLEWIRRIALVSLVVVLVVTAIFLRRWRAVVVVALLVVTSSLLWYLFIAAAGIYISVFLLFPLIFVVCIGSDYGLHVLCRQRAERLDVADATRDERAARVWETTGRAISLAAFTDGAAFLVYTPARLVSVSQVMAAVALAVLAVFVATALIVPALTAGSSRSRPRA